MLIPFKCRERHGEMLQYIYDEEYNLVFLKRQYGKRFDTPELEELGVHKNGSYDFDRLNQALDIEQNIGTWLPVHDSAMIKPAMRLHDICMRLDDPQLYGHDVGCSTAVAHLRSEQVLFNSTLVVEDLLSKDEQREMKARACIMDTNPDPYIPTKDTMGIAYGEIRKRSVKVSF